MSLIPITLSIATLFLAGAVAAEPWKEPPLGNQAIPYNTVAEAFASLKKKEAAVVSGDEKSGFVITEADRRTQWRFTSATQPAHPAVVRRIVRSNSEELSQVSILCDRKSAACSQHLTRYKTLEEMFGAPVMGIASKASSPR